MAWSLIFRLLLLQQMKDQEVHQSLHVIPGGNKNKTDRTSNPATVYELPEMQDVPFNKEERYGEF